MRQIAKVIGSICETVYRVATVIDPPSTQAALAERMGRSVGDRDVMVYRQALYYQGREEGIDCVASF
jgi:hypothetical protein